MEALPRVGNFSRRRYVRSPYSRHHRKEIAFIPENIGVYGGLTIEENLILATRSGRFFAARLNKVFELFPTLETYRTKQAWSLSGGGKTSAGRRAGHYRTKRPNADHQTNQGSGPLSHRRNGRRLSGGRRHHLNPVDRSFRVSCRSLQDYCRNAGLAGGAIYVVWLKDTGPETMLSFSIMIDILLMVVIGGTGTMWDAVIGAVLMTLA